MKKLILLSLLTLVCALTTNAKPKTTKDPYRLIVEGKFLAQKHINCTVYKMDKEGTFVSESHAKAHKYYSIECNVGEKYLVRFEDKKHNTKFLMIDASKGGYFVADVDFSRSYDAKLQLTKVGYALIPLTSSAIAQK